MKYFIFRSRQKTEEKTDWQIQLILWSLPVSCQPNSHSTDPQGGRLVLLDNRKTIGPYCVVVRCQSFLFISSLHCNLFMLEAGAPLYCLWRIILSLRTGQLFSVSSHLLGAVFSLLLLNKDVNRIYQRTPTKSILAPIIAEATDS